jgi:hypothetical protein
MAAVAAVDFAPAGGGSLASPHATAYSPQTTTRRGSRLGRTPGGGGGGTGEEAPATVQQQRRTNGNGYHADEAAAAADAAAAAGGGGGHGGARKMGGRGRGGASTLWPKGHVSLGSVLLWALLAVAVVGLHSCSIQYSCCIQLDPHSALKTPGFNPCNYSIK